MKFSRALKEFSEGEIFWEAEGPTNPAGGLTCPHISGKMPFQGSLLLMEPALLELFGNLVDRPRNPPA